MLTYFYKKQSNKTISTTGDMCPASNELFNIMISMSSQYQMHPKEDKGAGLDIQITEGGGGGGKNYKTQFK